MVGRGVSHYIFGASQTAILNIPVVDPKGCGSCLRVLSRKVLSSEVHLSSVELELSTQARVGNQWGRRLLWTSKQVRSGRWRWRERRVILELIESGAYRTRRHWPLTMRLGRGWDDCHSLCGWVVKGVTQTCSVPHQDPRIPSSFSVTGSVTVGQWLASSTRFFICQRGQTAASALPHLKVLLEQVRACNEVIT